MGKDLTITSRIDLNLGYTCNIRCRFCYYQRSLKKPKDLTTLQAKRWIKFFRKKGKSQIDLTGGEPTIRRDIFELVTYAKELGYTTVCLITNGLVMADCKFTEKLAQAGVNDVLFSLHGPNAEIHDSLTGSEGSFDKLIQAINNAKHLGMRCRSNTVVNGASYKHVKETAGVLAGLGINILNFILFNPIVEAQSSDADMNLSYQAAAPYLKEVIDGYKNQVKKITIRYIPFCLMRGYEGYVTNTPQIQYDPDEWDYYLRTYFRNGPIMWLGALCLGYFLHPSFSRLRKLDFYTAEREALKWSLAFKNKVKGPMCKKCAYEKICDALWRDYAKKKGFSELEAVSGEKISDPTFFMKKNAQFYI